MRFSVRNNTNVMLEIFWLSYNGQRQSFGSVVPGTSWENTSYVSHPWLIAREADDSCVQLIPDIGAEANVSVNAAFNDNYKLTAVHSGKALEVLGAGTADGANVHQWGYGGSANQKWRLELVSIGVYRLVVLHSGKCLDVSGASTADGANVQQYSCHTGTTNAGVFNRPMAAPSASSPSIATSVYVSWLSTADGAMRSNGPVLARTMRDG